MTAFINVCQKEWKALFITETSNSMAKVPNIKRIPYLPRSGRESATISLEHMPEVLLFKNYKRKTKIIYSIED